MRELYIPGGRRESQPKVIVKPSVVEKLGEPQVNYDQLDELFRKELGIDRTIVPTIHLRRRRLAPHLGVHVPFTNSINVYPVAIENKKQPQDTEVGMNTMHVVIHEGVHLSDSINHKRKTAVEVGLRVASTEAGWLYGNFVGSNLSEPLHSACALGFAVATNVAYQWTLDPTERRAHRIADDPELNRKYRDAITFPESKYKLP